jgi:4-hydroxy-4-methyl-2-oxoglutarate aldolase
VSAGEDSGMLPDLVVSRLYTAVVSDILDDLGHRHHVLHPAIRPRAGGQVIAGPANPFLVTEVDQIAAEPYTGEIAALDDIRPGEVITTTPAATDPCGRYNAYTAAPTRAQAAR